MDKRVFIFTESGKNNNYASALERQGLSFVESENVSFANDCDALLLIGGGDVSPCLYGQTNVKSAGIDLEKDVKELYLIKLFCKNKKPVLGVCRGMQIINVFFGGSLFQDAPEAILHKGKNGEDVFHSVTCVENTFMRRLYNENCTVNSNHHQIVNSFGKEIKCSAYSKDKAPEALFHNNLPIIAVQFHPERMENGDKIYRCFKELILENNGL